MGTVSEGVTAVWDVALWDDPAAIWNGVEPTWRDVECEVIEMRLESGRARVTDPFPPGRAEIVVDNASGWADPTISTDVPGVLTMRPGWAIRVGVEHTTLGTRWLWRGFIDALEPVHSPVEWDTVMLRCVDAAGESGRGKLRDIVESGADESAATRFGRILNRVNWPFSKRIIDAASTELFAAALEGQVIDLLTRTSDSAGGWAFGDENGNVVFRNRDWLFYERDAPPDATIGNIGGSDVCPFEFQRAFDRKSIATQVIVDRTPPEGFEPTTPIILNDIPGQVRYGVEPFERTDLWTRDDNDASRIAVRLLATRNATVSMPRLAAVSFDAATTAAALDLMSTVSITTPSRYRCRFARTATNVYEVVEDPYGSGLVVHDVDDWVEDPAGSGLFDDIGMGVTWSENPAGLMELVESTVELVFDDEFFAVGVVHEITPDEWLCHISLDRAGYYKRLADPPYVWDTALWAQALWN